MYEKNKRGFTLVEIIVVLVILAILAAIAVPTTFGYVDEKKREN
ncbi:type IV pilin protein [Faecalibacillus faecis]